MKAFVVSLLLACAGLVSAVPTASNTSSTSDLPVVDLGYALQQASGFNSTGVTGGYYNFSNIRYAAPPTGDLRWAAPQSPAVNRSVIETGSVDRHCAQAYPYWLDIAEVFLDYYLSGELTNFTPADFGAPTAVAEDPATTEDCLFLDVFVPASVWESRNTTKVPVLFWIYGGGFTEGYKSASGSPTGLLERSLENGGAIYIAPNYRMGAFGWLSGPKFVAEGGLPNTGLYDQRFALEWAQQYASLFGGDPDQVTVFGESAGASSIEHHITAYGGANGSAPFAKAIPQSPAFEPVPFTSLQDEIYEDFLAVAGVSTLAELRNLSFDDLVTANTEIVEESDYGSFTFGPVVDGAYVPALPGQLLAAGKFDSNVTVMLGQNQREGLLFTNPLYNSDEGSTLLEGALTDTFPSLLNNTAQLDYILNTLYPADFSGSQGYTDQITRGASIVADFAIICNTFYLDKALHNKTHSYEFAVWPATHGADVYYTYFTGDADSAATTDVEDPTVAVELQRYIVNFAATGNPNGAGLPLFPGYGNGTVNVLNTTGTYPAKDPADTYRCDYWQSAVWEQY